MVLLQYTVNPLYYRPSYPSTRAEPELLSWTRLLLQPELCINDKNLGKWCRHLVWIYLCQEKTAIMTIISDCAVETTALRSCLVLAEKSALIWTLHARNQWQKLHTFYRTWIYVRYMLSPICLSVIRRLSVGNVHAPYSGDWNFWQCHYFLPWPYVTVQ